MSGIHPLNLNTNRSPTVHHSGGCLYRSNNLQQTQQQCNSFDQSQVHLVPQKSAGYQNFHDMNVQFDPNNAINNNAYFHQHTGHPVGGKHTVHWFRRGLRLHDSPSLLEGIKYSNTFRCIFILDPWFAGTSNVGINKWR